MFEWDSCFKSMNMIKRFLVLIVCVFVGLFMACRTGVHVIDYPAFQVKNTSSLEITRLERNDTVTVVYAEVYQEPGSWIRVASSMYIQAEGQKYLIRGADGLKLDEVFWMPDSGKYAFKLFFPPLSRRVSMVDIIEDRMNVRGWHIWGLSLNPGIEIAPSAIRCEMAARDWQKANVLPPAELKMGKTKVKVILCGYHELMDGREVSLSVSDLFGGRGEFSKSIDGNHSCTFEFDQYATGGVYVDNALFHLMFFSAPGDDVEVYVDLQEATRRASRYQKDRMKAYPLAYIVGNSEYTSLNNDLQGQNTTIEFFPESFYSEILGMNADEYTNHVMKYYRAALDGLVNDATLPEGVKQYMKVNLRSRAAILICSGEGYLEQAHRRANHIDWNQRVIDFKAPAFTDKHFAILEELELNHSDMLYSENFPYCFKCVAFRVTSLERLEQLLGVDKGFLIDYFKLRGIYDQLENLNSLTAEQQENLASVDPYYAQAFEQMRKKIEADVIESMVKVGDRIRETPRVADEKLIDAIAARYKGKVVLIDFWATWCAPCRESIARFEPRKKQFENDRVVFVYITGEHAPKTKWLEMIGDIQGEHYRLDGKQWNYVCRQFKIDGIPSYMVVDKKGKVQLRNDFRDIGIETGLRQVLD